VMRRCTLVLSPSPERLSTSAQRSHHRMSTTYPDIGK
jgi:hypothetical protein